MRISEKICGAAQPCEICFREFDGKETFLGGIGSRLCLKCGRWVCPLHSKQTNHERYNEGICSDCGSSTKL